VPFAHGVVELELADLARLARKIRTADVPLRAFFVRAKNERTFRRADEQKNIAVFE